jgi:pimeloyl-ACP methyl ester carboxylesterase
MAFARLAGRRIEYRIIGAQNRAPPLVLLHEGLGSVAMWRDFPDKLAARIGARALVYSRLGYGQSDRLASKRSVRFMHDEALETLPLLLDRLGIERPLLVGHSDGASIALIYAAAAGRGIDGLVLIAPHVFVEPVCLASIAAIRKVYRDGDLKARLAKYHAHVDDAFFGWADVWLDPTFRTWSIEDLVPRVQAPMLLIQGLEDAYGTLAQLDRIEAAATAPTARRVLPECGHSPHRDAEATVIDAIAGFAAGLATSQAPRA